jgi:hypothetical protein
MTDLVTVSTFTSPLDAHLARGRLEAEGIPAVVAHDNHVWADWAYSNALGGVKLQVPRGRLAEAEKILQAHHNGEYASALEDEFGELPEPACPRCGSADFSSHAPNSLLALVIFTLGLGVIFPLRKSEHRCNNCNFEWRD